MNTKTEIIGAAALAILVVLLVLWYMNEHPAPFVNTPFSPTASSTTPTTNVEPQTINDSGAYYDATAKYPGATPLSVGNTEAVAAMRQFELDTIAEFKQEAANTPDMGIGEAGVEQRKQTLDIDYRSTSAPHSVSYMFVQHADTGGAHPNTYFRTFTFDTRTGKSLALADLFTPGTAYLTQLSQLSRELLPAIIAKNSGSAIADINPNMLSNGTIAEQANFANWYLEGSSLVIAFEPYQVAPYAAGPQTLSIPLSRFSNLKAEYR
ncbi:MAG: DUF3298 domain-containing protein [Bacillota bacterium]